MAGGATTPPSSPRQSSRGAPFSSFHSPSAPPLEDRKARVAWSEARAKGTRVRSRHPRRRRLRLNAIRDGDRPQAGGGSGDGGDHTPRSGSTDSHRQILFRNAGAHPVRDAMFDIDGVQPLARTVFSRGRVDQRSRIEPRGVRHPRIVRGDSLRRRGGFARGHGDAPDIHFLGREECPSRNR